MVVSITDTGIGFPSAQLERVFDLFAQVDAPGSTPQAGLGLGLTLVRRLVELHGGDEGHGMETILEKLIARTSGVVAEVGASLPKGFLEEVADPVLRGGLGRAAKQWAVQ